MDETLREREMIKVLTIKERYDRENAIRIDRSTSVLSFGIKFLDNALEGISKHDLILVGSPTGSGKTELVTHMAAYNAFRGRRVLFFALEAEECEIESRIKYKVAVDRYLKACTESGTIAKKISYRNYYYNRLGSEFELFIKAAEKVLIERLQNLTTVYRQREFTVDDLQRHLMAVKDNTDLVVIDHLNYFDFDEPNENRAVTAIVKKIRDLALLSGLPIILVAHIKKMERKLKPLVPEIEDFHGTSNITKIATKAILLAADPNIPTNPNLLTTYFRIAKFRVDGSTTRYIAKCIFNNISNRYESDFVIGTLTNEGRNFTAIENKAELPDWARRGDL